MTNRFRDAMALLASAVKIIATDSENGRHGFTASDVSSVSDMPPTLLVCVNRTALVHPHLLKHRKLAVNVLGAAHANLSNRFSSEVLDMSKRFDEGG